MIGMVFRPDVTSAERRVARKARTTSSNDRHEAVALACRSRGFTCASASVKGYARSAPFAMSKFALRRLAQSMARELSPQKTHVAHCVVDGVVRRSGGPRRPVSKHRQ